MREIHEVTTCNRCGKKAVVNRTKGEEYSVRLSGWGCPYPENDLCPECYKLYRETMDQFYKGATLIDLTGGGKQNDEEKSHH